MNCILASHYHLHIELGLRLSNQVGAPKRISTQGILRQLFHYTCLMDIHTVHCDTGDLCGWWKLFAEKLPSLFVFGSSGRHFVIVTLTHSALSMYTIVSKSGTVSVQQNILQHQFIETHFKNLPLWFLQMCSTWTKKHFLGVPPIENTVTSYSAIICPNLCPILWSWVDTEAPEDVL